jgi:hypothetical protein
MAKPTSPHKLRFTAHAENMLHERGILREWAMDTLTEPDWTTPNLHPDRTRAFRAIPDAGGKILRVVYSKASGEHRVVTVFFDRNAKRPEGSGV